ncbi:magnesium transporter [Actinopolymorpha sp. B9G3]|uniref:magnesium transporter n=1 Tax=Actinopolymorpha sp. B9G3 TaxID=3158970 RepID=UPI0032D8C6FD
MAERQILGTAAQHASTEIPVAGPEDRVADVIDALRGRRFDSAAVIAVCTSGRLVGLVTIERLLVAPPDARALDVSDRQPPVVAPDTDQEHAAWAAIRQGESGLAVVDADGTFRGLIPPQRLLAVLLEEHDEDLARLGGYLRSAATARAASEERVRLRLWHRVPWLLLGLLGALAAAGLIGGFEADLERQVLLAFFVPGVVYMADAVGTQTETLVIRGLSVGVGIRRVVVRELVTGLLVGLLLALLTLPVTVAVWGNVGVSLAVSLALFAACSIATVVAMALPWLFHRLGRDPAFGSGPLATVVQDLLSIAIYLVIARAILG